ncbi:hypothetical protein HYH03_001892 [Edaphochlamys debaryana]|uniref:BTB domain-containing protein n=1 Tax=Edaphochlamys debaryana TaxID=47281 RepID=A0A835YG54_9CHLO|nr:hypothetical protein HYH03_001892 [Edaphochlamys debaryana]|eukprot:KAG2500316.1 hypothetical protein HYH03_001892 [Edaphochlamys debaryana]
MVRTQAVQPAAGPDGALIIATRTALYRLPLNPDGSPAARVPVLLAGLEGVEGTQDGRVEEARFTDLCGCAVDGEGNVIVADIAEVMEGDRLEDEEGEHMDYRTAVRRLALDGTVTTLVPRPGRGLGLKGTYGRPVILHTGHLCLTSSAESAIRVLGLGLKPCPLLCPASKARAPCGSLHADMGALLDAQPDGTADLTLVPLLPAAAGGFADGAAAELGLPEADPDAFALVLRWVYTGAVDIPSALAPAVAELADRLLLPELCSDAQAVVLSGVSAETVVGSLLWAERLGGSFAPLLSQLKAWCAERGEEVAAVPHSLKRLAKSPDLMATLMADLLAGGVKRRRTA